MSVEDDGPGLEAANAMKPSGIGLTNTRARLMQMYGDAAKFSIASREGRGVVATIALPLQVTSLNLSGDRLEAHGSDRIAG